MKTKLSLFIFILCFYSDTLFGQSDTIYPNRDSVKIMADKAPDDKVYTFVEEMPEFVGGKVAREKYLLENTRYPEHAKRKKIEGTSYIGFTVKKDGSISDVKLKRGSNEELDREAIRVVREMPNWIPGHQNGKAVNVDLLCPVKFTLSKN